jgi:transcriptional regulator with XRE-family HTH domain
MTDVEPGTLGTTLREVRHLHGLSLKAVAEPADISVAYLVKLERGEVQAPSPHVLHRLAATLAVDYADLMRLAGYVVPEHGSARHTSPLLQAFSAKQVTDDETRALAAFLDIYRGGRSG